jgi:hypothetical protein
MPSGSSNQAKPDRSGARPDDGGLEAAIGQCPRCNAPLAGLPAVHRCPRCGLAYDAHTRVWRPTGIWRYGKVCTLVAVAGVSVPIGIIKASSLGAEGVLAGMACFAGWVAMLALMIHLRGPFIAVTPNGVVYRRVYRVHTIPWPAVNGAGVSGDLEDRTVLYTSVRWCHRLDVTSLLPPADPCHVFCVAVHEGKQRYAG